MGIWGGAEDVPWITSTLLVRFFDKYYVATIPKSRTEFLEYSFYFLKQLVLDSRYL